MCSAYNSTYVHDILRHVIISNKHGVYELPNELSNDLSLRILRNWEMSGKSYNFIELQPSAQSFSQNENFVSINKKLLKKRN